MKETSMDEFPMIYKFDDYPKAIAERGEEVLFRKNTLIASPGDALEGFYLIKEGRVIAYEYLPKGNEKILCILEKNSVFLESNVLFELPVFCYFKTTMDTSAVFLRRKDLLELLACDLNFTLFLMQAISIKFYSHVNHAGEMISHDTEWRVCSLLLTFAKNFGVKEGARIKINFNISQQFISDILGINRITTVRIIKNLKKKKLIEQTDGYYYLTDIQKLSCYRMSI